jgi:homocitrate synthase NifV
LIKIIDNTLSAFDSCLPSKEELLTFCQLLFTIGVDMIELSIAAFEKMQQLPDRGKFVLRIEDISQMEDYPDFFRYVCHRQEIADKEIAVKVITEVRINDIREINKLRALDSCKELRIVGLDDIICEDFDVVVKDIFKTLPNCKLNLCPENSLHCASAIAVQWILNGEKEITSSFAGCKGNAATEEVLMALRLSMRHKPTRDLTVLPEITALYEKITGSSVSNKKPILGKNIFKVEAGVHADGLIKNPATYEAFSPCLVGRKSEIIIGKHSGLKAVKLKIEEKGILLPKDSIIEKILCEIRKFCTEKRNSLNDSEFIELVNEVIAYEGKQIYS